jgi:hypothetical protein
LPAKQTRIFKHDSDTIGVHQKHLIVLPILRRYFEEPTPASTSVRADIFFRNWMGRFDVDYSNLWCVRS